ETRRADAFMLLIQTAAAGGNLPAHGGDRPQVHITLDYHTLITGLGKAGIVGAENLDGLSAGDARRLACDADIIPVVLGSDSKPLDVGRAHRMFPAAIRTALILRDGGCAFPGCTVTPRACEAHHIVPWWAGGITCLANAVLLCPHHHRLVEPDPDQSPESQWHVHLDPDTGLPWFTPPTHIDPGRTPKLHRRFQLRAILHQHQPPGRNRDGSQRRPPRRHNLGRRLPRGLTAPTQAPPRPTPQPPPQQSESSPAWRYQE
ncbi:HNH endonuclease signature motif containing protein, partial [Tessaracoccus lubricantis]|uniref:HNH endonuclease signature motif containing protein n=1 Tax=Tessaracoccus lubricantis TaxID=545543 RepID=UPI0031EB5CD5